jgi:hypothetical protein
MPSLAAADEGFTPLFDGKTLNGWKLLGGHGSGYSVQDGKIVLPRGGGGNLLYEKEFANFILRFEFKLEEGSNNGLAIRAPLSDADMAYQGMELQIIDNTAERYKNIQPWQKHGSLYHVFPARTGALKPTGEWNEQEVRALGRQVTVILNGVTIPACSGNPGTSDFWVTTSRSSSAISASKQCRGCRADRSFDPAPGRPSRDGDRPLCQRMATVTVLAHADMQQAARFHAVYNSISPTSTRTFST